MYRMTWPRKRKLPKSQDMLATHASSHSKVMKFMLSKTRILLVQAAGHPTNIIVPAFRPHYLTRNPSTSHVSYHAWLRSSLERPFTVASLFNA